MRALMFVPLALVALPALAQCEEASWGTLCEQNLRIKTGFCPTLSLDGGPGSRTWDLMGSSGGFYLLDVTAGTMPVWVQAGAPTNSLVLSDTGAIGLGTSSPQATVHVQRRDGTARLLIENKGRYTVSRPMLVLAGSAPKTVQFVNTAQPDRPWRIGQTWAGNGDFAVASALGDVLTLASSGDMTLAGALTQMSSRDSKTDVEPVDGHALLARVATLPLSMWSYKANTARHVGPMAQDFAAAFGLGQDETHIAPSDLAGVGLVAAQALHERSQVLTRRIEELEERLRGVDAQRDVLAAELDAIESSLPDAQP